MVTSAFVSAVAASSAMSPNISAYQSPTDTLPSSSQNYRENTSPYSFAQRPHREGSKRRGLEARKSSGGGNGKGFGVGAYGEREKRNRALCPWADSSEDEPSPHSSIFEAPLVSDEEGESLRANEKGRISTPGSTGSGSPGADQGRISGDGASPKSRSRSRQRRRSLETILERNSAGSFRGTNISRRNSISSADAVLEAEETVEDKEEWSSLLPKGKGRRKSKSLGDSTDTEDEGGDGYFSQVYDYASPTMPVHPVCTGSINAPNTPAELPSPMLTPPISVSYFNRNYGSSSPVRSSLLAVAPTFRPPVSGYRSYGTMTSHPFHFAPLAQSGSFNGVGSLNRDSTDEGPGGDGRVTPDSLGSDHGSARGGLLGRSRSGVSTSSSIESSGWRFWVGTLCCCLRPWGGRREVED